MGRRNYNDAPDRVRCIDGTLWRHDPQPDDPYLETDIGQCEECRGHGCENELQPVKSDYPKSKTPPSR